MIGDPRTMPMRDLLETLPATYYAAEASWLFLAVGFERVKRDGGYKDLGLPTWEAYLQSEFPRLSKDAVLKMLRSARYVEQTETALHEALLAGPDKGSAEEPGRRSASTTSIPGWFTTARLLALRDKTLAFDDATRTRRGKHPTDNEVRVSEEKWREVHEGAFRGGWSERAVRAAVSRLSAGLSYVRPPAPDTPDGTRLHQAAGSIAYATDALLRVRPIVQQGGDLTIHGRQEFLDAVEDFFLAAVRVFGAKAVEAIVRSARRKMGEDVEAGPDEPETARARRYLALVAGTASRGKGEKA